MAGGNSLDGNSVFLHVVSKAVYDRQGIVLEILEEGTRAFATRETVEYFLQDHYPESSYSFLSLTEIARKGQNMDRHVYVRITGPMRERPVRWFEGEIG